MAFSLPVRCVPSKEVWEDRNVLGSGSGLRNTFRITVGFCSLGSKHPEGIEEKLFWSTVWRCYLKDQQGWWGGGIPIPAMGIEGRIFKSGDLWISGQFRAEEEQKWGGPQERERGRWRQQEESSLWLCWNFAQETNTFRSEEILFRLPALWVNRKRELTKSCQCQQEYLI